ncbi:hypothetical protein [Microbacterium candidum]|uniref:Uncharacterized protein n=1 Tax=Microbacterium candidum TaxID=3041922 RepID=A0ABT7N1H3_9MICO|nr:hypothetical protein [Microbacterium sp. ASV49]MDL9980533.1 hypothetical protein [Microbacterium sp. ASV49]
MAEADSLAAEALSRLADDADHRDAERTLRAAAWTDVGAGDWAFVLGAPSVRLVARISPFDPVGPFTAALYRKAAGTRRVPRLYGHRRLAGGGDLQLMERLEGVSDEDAAAFRRRIVAGDADLHDLITAVRRIHDEALRTLPWCGPLDLNPGNVMRSAAGTLVLLDPFYADGPNLYRTAAEHPEIVVERIREEERRFITDIPLTASGPWEPGAQDALRAGLAAADARLRRA